MVQPAPGTMVVEGRELGPRTACRGFVEAMMARGAGGTVLGDGQTRWTMAGARVEPGPGRWHIIATFEWELLSRVELFAQQPGDGKSWAEWKRENELERKAYHEAWARLAFGRALEPMAFDPGDGGRPVTPFEIGPEHPMRAAYLWGEVTSFYDAKGGQAFLRILYARMVDEPGSAGVVYV